MDVDYTLESFRVPDLHPRSQERPPKSGRVPDFFENIFFRFLDVSRCFGGFVNFFFWKYFLGTKCWKSDWQNFRNFSSHFFKNGPKKNEKKKLPKPLKHRETLRNLITKLKKLGTLPDFGGCSWLLGWISGT